MALIDREWEGFDLESLELSGSDCEYQKITTATIKTFGHSIENYFFDHMIFASLLRRQIPGSLSAGMLRLIQEQFPKICIFALSYSLAAKHMHLINRLSGLLCIKHVDIRDSDFVLNEEFINGLLERSVKKEIGGEFVNATRSFQLKIDERNLGNDTTKWASHGHLGGEAIWTCVAKILDLSGVSGEICEQVERGMKNDKFKHGADVIAAGPLERRPLEWLARWLLGLEHMQVA